jgi:DNA polymerase-3 subunit gamma/tau
MAVLYRDYRPKKFSEVITQKHVISTLKNAVASGNFAHAYLFTGPRGTGKTSVARILARALNCLNPKDGEPCNECAICKQFLDNTSLDFNEIDAASNTGVENVREIIEHLKFSPTQAKYKIFIVDEVHMLSKGAFNALLKTLEEPPAHAIFILATTEVHKVPATVISRTQRFDFKKAKHDDLFKHIEEIAKKEKIPLNKEGLEMVVNASEGSVRDALSILGKLASFEEKDLLHAEKLLGLTNLSSSQDFLDLLLQKNGGEAINFLENLFSSGIDPVQFNKDFLEYLRKVLMTVIGAEVTFVFDEIQKTKLYEQVKSSSAAQILNIIRLFLKANKDFQISPNLELPMEIAAAEACAGKEQEPRNQGIVNRKEETIEPEAKAEEKTEEKTEEPKGRKLASKQIFTEEVQRAWPAILSEIKLKASTLFAVMKNARIKEVENNVLCLAFDYKFHKESLDQAKNKEIVNRVLQSYFDTQIVIQTILEKEEKNNKSEASSLIADVFGEGAV